MAPFVDPAVLVGTETRDDAAVYRLDAEKALVCTTDFFTPVVDDPYDFGRIAAANALSDVYAMGGTPIFALNLVGFPARTLPMELLGQILEGGNTIAREAGIPILGGHSIDDPEPKYGMVAIGLVHPDRVWRNGGARPGDLLVLTKPLGIGVLTTAIKRELASDAEIEAAVRSMTTLNRAAADALHEVEASVHAVTDVTGYGLLGHLLEMVDASGCRARIDVAAIPILDGARAHAERGAIPGGSKANLESAAPRVTFAPTVDALTQLLLADAQTSGGLLAAIAPEALPALTDAAARRGVPVLAVIGRFEAGDPGVTAV